MGWMYLVLAAFGGFMVGGTFGLMLGCCLAMAGRESREGRNEHEYNHSEN